MSLVDASNACTQGFFITFEGGEGCGKSTQIKKLYTHLKELSLVDKAPPALLTREPGGSTQCDLIRGLLLTHEWEPMTEALLFAANRHEHCSKVNIVSQCKAHSR